MLGGGFAESSSWAGFDSDFPERAKPYTEDYDYDSDSDLEDADEGIDSASLSSTAQGTNGRYRVCNGRQDILNEPQSCGAPKMANQTGEALYQNHMAIDLISQHLGSADIHDSESPGRLTETGCCQVVIRDASVHT